MTRDIAPHDLRDPAATIAFSHGATVKEVQRKLGHAKASVTLDRYTGVLESMQARPTNGSTRPSGACSFRRVSRSSPSFSVLTRPGKAADIRRTA